MRNLFILIAACAVFCFVQCDSPAKQVTSSANVAAADTTANPLLYGKDWMLVELNGKPVSVDSTMGRAPHIQFNEAEGRFSGNGGCNGLSGAVELKGMNRISFLRIIRTQMACPALEIENEFLKVLETADNFNVSDTALVLNRARMAPLARLRPAQ